ncbi:MAG: type IV pilus assembly protein PilM [Acidobacteria bacterium]|nr:type IV pilus assembly protein PilM [Acidobacteriota bacterium]
MCSSARGLALLRLACILHGVTGGGGDHLSVRGLKRLFGRTIPLVGLDIGSSAVKVVEVVRHRSRAIATVGRASTPVGSIVDGAIVRPYDVAAAIRQAFAASGIRRRDVAVALPGSAVIVKRIELPPTPPTQLAGAVAREAARQLPFNPDDVHFDFHLNGAGPPGADGPLDVMLVAARRETVKAYVGAVVEAGRTPAVIDVGALALQNVFEWTEGRAQEAPMDVPAHACVALLDVGASATTVNVVRAGTSLLTRNVPTGGNACSEALQRELDLSFDIAERLKLGLPARGWTPADAAPVLRGAADALALEVQRTLEFVEAGTAEGGSDPQRRIDRIALAGGASRAAALDAALRAHFGDVVRPLNPFDRLTVKNLPADDPTGADALRASASIAVGLALRGLDER